jgi:hypothetical protein
MKTEARDKFIISPKGKSKEETRRGTNADV